MKEIAYRFFTPKSCLLLLFGFFISNLTFAQGEEDATQRKAKSPVVYPRHKITTDLFAPFSRSMLFYYELLLPNQKMAIRVPLGFQFTDEGARYAFVSWYKDDYELVREYPYVSSHYKREAGIYTGTAVLFYLNPPKRFRPYLAPEAMTGLFFRKYKNTLIDMVDSTYSYTPLKDKMKYAFVLGGGLSFGVQAITKRKISYGMEAGLGLAADIASSYSYDFLFYRRISFHFGYHFDGGKRKKTISE